MKCSEILGDVQKGLDEEAKLKAAKVVRARLLEMEATAKALAIQKLQFQDLLDQNIADVVDAE